MRTPALRIALLAALVTAVAGWQPAERQVRRMSLHNRVLLNRAVVAGQRTIEVMIAARSGEAARVSARVGDLGGSVRRIEPDLDYLRIEVPTAALLAIVEHAAVDAYQISSSSRGTWYRDGPPQSNAEMFRGFERLVARGPSEPAVGSALPVLQPEQARGAGFTADEDAGVGEWLARHPTYDGRGVTIGLLETGQPEFLHPTIGKAATLDGRDVPKLAGIINTVDPERADETRVRLAHEAECRTTWCRLGDLTYILPEPGSYRLGTFRVRVAPNLVHEFAVVENRTTGDLRVDTDGDADFRDEAILADVNTRFEPATLKLIHPRPRELGFVIARGRAPDVIHVYASLGGHQAMTLSVAAGSRTPDGLASGVAPGARALLVRENTADYRLRDFVESYIEAARRPDVDVLTDSEGISIVPDTTADFMGVFFRRLVATYGKPIFHAAGNTQLHPQTVSALGDAFAVGGSIGPSSYAALFGGATIPEPTVHHTSAGGPGLDGALKPDFIAPVHRISADLFTSPGALLPKNAPVTRLPPGYQVSCCTSASAPYAAGIAALLISAARQERLPYSVRSLGRALHAGARFLPGAPAHHQGSGLLDVNAAWLELQRDVEIPRIRAAATVAHPLAAYTARGITGEGILERDGWHAGMSAQRSVRLRRESGRPGPVTFRISWTGNDGTFSTSREIVLPLNEAVSLPVGVNVTSTGAHAAMLNLHDAATDAIVFRISAVIVAAERFDPRRQEIRIASSLPLLHGHTHYAAIPEGVGAIGLELHVTRGSVRPSVLPSHGLQSGYYAHLGPVVGRTFPVGRYRVILPNPPPGVWAVHVGNTSARAESDLSLVSTETAEYSITMRLLAASVDMAARDGDSFDVTTSNTGADIHEPALDVSVGTSATQRAASLASGLPNLFDIDVPKGAGTLALQLRGRDGHRGTFELHLYDCTSGECFSYDLAIPPSARQTVVVRRPKAGRWVAAVNSAPFPTAPAEFVLEEIVTIGTRRHTIARPLAPGARRIERVDAAAVIPPPAGRTRVVMCELVDAAVERDAVAFPWENRPLVAKPSNMSAAAGFKVRPY